METPETAKTNDQAAAATFVEEKRDDAENKGITAGDIGQTARTAASPVSQQTASDGGASHDEAEKTQKTESGDVSLSSSVVGAPLCGACGCF